LATKFGTEIFVSLLHTVKSSSKDWISYELIFILLQLLLLSFYVFSF